MSTKKRTDTIRILVSTHPTLVGSSKLTHIVGELNKVSAAARISKHNGWLLGVLHTTRALDTSLEQVLAHKGWTTAKPSLGGYLMTFVSHAVLSAGERTRWQQSIVKKRNKYMHEAGAMPTQLERDKILSEMEACLTIVLGRL